MESGDTALERALGRAQAREGDWEQAAPCWEQVQELAEAEERGDVALEAGIRAIDCWRRGDRPVRVLERIELLEGRLPDVELEALVWIHGAAACLDLGRLEEGEGHARRIMGLVQEGPVRELAADTLAGVLVASGQIAPLGELLDAWEDGEREVGIAIRFRRAQVAQLNGDWNRARERLLSCALELEGEDPPNPSALGAVWEGLARVARDQGEVEEAFSLLDRAWIAWERAGRESGCVRVAVERAMTAHGDASHAFLPGGLDAGVSFCKERSLVLLEGRARLARGLSRWTAGSDGAIEDLSAAVFLGEQCGAPFLSGQARLERHQRDGGQGAGVLERALAELQADSLLRARVWQAIRAARG